MYLRGSKWNMRQRRPRVNWLLVIVVLVLIGIVTYLDRFILPTATGPWLPTMTATRQAEWYVDQADGLFQQGKLLESIDAYLEAIRIRPEEAATYIALARVQIFAGKYDEALVNTENSLLLNNNNSMAYAVRGWALTYKLDYTNADDSLKKALSLDPANGQAHAYNAFLYGKMYENNAGPHPDPVQTAIDESNAAISLAPNSLEAHWARGYILTLTSPDNLPLAIEQYKEAIAINPNIAMLHLELGVAYKGNTNIEEALQEYVLANTYNPTDYLPELYSSRADILIGEYDKAIQWAEEAVQDAPDNADLYGNLGYMLYKRERFDDANEQLALAIEGGTTSDGHTITALTPDPADSWIRKYYYAYTISLSNTGDCAKVILLNQKILDYFREDPYSKLNADIAAENCSNSLKTPSPPAPATAEMTPTP